jgi:putative membrane protein
MYRSQQRHRTILCVVLAGFGACMSTSQTATKLPSSVQSARIGSSSRDDANTLALLHTSNVGEIMAGTMAQQRATDPAVRSFAEMMVSQHTRLDREGNALAQQIGVTPALPDSTLPQVQRAELDSLRAATVGTAFDRRYVEQQVIAHQRTLELVDATIPTAQHAELKTALRSQIRPVVSRHLTQARELQSRLTGVAANPGAPNPARPTTTTTSGGSVTLPPPPGTDTMSTKKP